MSQTLLPDLRRMHSFCRQCHTWLWTSWTTSLRRKHFYVHSRHCEETIALRPHCQRPMWRGSKCRHCLSTAVRSVASV
jgi:RNase P subunit RPR2